MIREDELGTLRTVDNIAARPIDLSNPADEWRVDKELAGGGSLMDIGIYALNGARYPVGEEPLEFMATILNPKGDEGFTDVEDIVSWRMRFPSGVIANCLTGYSFSGNRFSVYGSDASLTLEPATDYYEHGLRVMTAQDQTEPQIQERNQFALEMDHLSEAVLNDTPVKTPGEEGMQDVRLMMKIYEAAETRAPVAVDWSYQRDVPAQEGRNNRCNYKGRVKPPPLLICR